MKVINPFQINDLGIRSFLKVILVIQLVMLVMVGLAAVGLYIPIIRQIIGFIYLAFVPGVIIIRILKIHNLGETKFVLYSAGLSISFVMFAGALINSLLPNLGISQPISSLPLTVSLSIFIAILCAIAYIRDRKSQPLGIYLENINILPSYLLLLLMPILTIFGTSIINVYQNSSIIILLIFVIAIIAILIAFDILVPVKAYSLAIYAIAISLVFHVSLISPYPLAWNIDTEYFYSELVATGGYWNSSTTFSTINSLLSIVMLAPIYSKVLDINMIWVLKGIFPFIHSLLPLAIFAACREQMGAKKAFFSAFFFMSLSGFFDVMTLFRREQIAMLFLALLVLVMLDNKLTSIEKSTFSIVFAISLPISHYGTSYLSTVIFLLSMIFLYLTSNKQMFLNKIINKKTNKNSTENLQKNTNRPDVLKLGLILVWLVFMLSWFMFIAGGASFNSFVGVMKASIISLTDLFSVEQRPEVIFNAMGLGLKPANVLGWMFRIVHYFTEVLIVTGFIALVVRPKIFKLKEEYRALLIVTALFLFAIMFLPTMGKSWDTMRFYNFVLVTIAPLIIFGCEAIWELTSWLTKYELLPQINKLKQHNSPIMPRYHNKYKYIYMKFIVIAILVPYFLFNTGFLYEISGESRSSRLAPWKLDSGYFNNREVSGAEWLDSVSSERAIVIGDGFSTDLLSFWFQVSRFALEKNVHDKNAYIFLRTWNVEKQEVLMYDGIRETNTYYNPEDIPVLRDAINNKIYYNGGAQVFAPRL